MFRNALIPCLGMVLLVLSCKSPEARRPEQRSTGTFIKESAERNKALYEQEEAFITKLIAQDTSRTYSASPSGFWYAYQVQDTLASPLPKFGDEVVFTYDVRRLDGSIVLSQEDTGIQNYVIDQTNQDLISGLRDGLKLMKAGETVDFIFPSYKAYGYYGIENKLGTNVPVQSTVTLQSLKQTLEN